MNYPTELHRVKYFTRSESHRLSNLLKLNSPFSKLQNVSDICVIGFELADLILEEIENENT